MSSVFASVLYTVVRFNSNGGEPFSRTGLVQMSRVFMLLPRDVLYVHRAICFHVGFVVAPLTFLLAKVYLHVLDWRQYIFLSCVCVFLRSYWVYFIYLHRHKCSAVQKSAGKYTSGCVFREAALVN